MKKLLLSVVLLSFSYVCSAQLQVDLGGAFSFEYVGLNTDGTVKYDVYFNYSSDSGWAGSTSTSFGRYRKVSQAAPYPQVSMSSVLQVGKQSKCNDDYNYNRMRWKQTIDLDPYSQYEFVHNWCCRVPYIANIDTTGGVPNQYVRAIILTGRSGVRAYNNSPQYSAEYYSAPINTPTPIEICSSDPDGDSLSFSFIPSKKGSMSQYFLNMYNIDYDTTNGYTNATPLGPGGEFTLDANNRVLMVKNDSAQFNLLTVRIIEWAKDTNNVPKIMGVTNREIMVDFTDNYTPSMYGISANYASSTLNSDSVYVNLKEDISITSHSLDSNIVCLVSPAGDTSAVNAIHYAGSNSELFLHTDSIDLPGVWKVYFTQHGNFANRGDCGEPLIDTVLLNIPIPDIDLVGDTGYVYVGSPSQYYVVNGQFYDSISWTCTNGIITAGQHDSIQVEWGATSNGPGFLLAEAVKLKDGSNFILSVSRDSLTVDVNGLSLEDLANDVSVYPNPSAYEIEVKGLNDGVQYDVINPAGLTILKGRLEDSKVNVSTLPSGPYLLKFSADGKFLMKELIISR